MVLKAIFSLSLSLSRKANHSELIMEKRLGFYILTDKNFLYISGCKNDDSRSSNIRSVLASVSYVLHSDVLSARNYK